MVRRLKKALLFLLILMFFATGTAYANENAAYIQKHNPLLTTKTYNRGLPLSLDSNSGLLVFKTLSPLRSLFNNSAFSISVFLFSFMAWLSTLFIFFKQKIKFKQTENLIFYILNSGYEVTEYDFINFKKTEYKINGSSLISSVSLFDKDKIFGEIKDYKNTKKGTILNEESIFKLIDSSGLKQFGIKTKTIEGNCTYFYYTLKAIPKTKSKPGNIFVLKQSIKAPDPSNEAIGFPAEAFSSSEKEKIQTDILLSRLSHEIRTPLNAILGYIEIAKKSSGNPEKINICIEKLELPANHILSMVNNTLDASYIKSGKIKLSKISFNINQLISSVSSMFYIQAKQKNINFKVLLHNITEEYLIGDPMRLTQILLNLLSNALKFTPSKENVTFLISQGKITNGKISVTFEVSDTGIGISTEFLDKIFNPFEQQDAFISQNFGGTGLGLSISKSLVDMMEGEIKVKSIKGGKTTFTVHLDLEIEKEDNNKINIDYDFSHINILTLENEKNDIDYINNLLALFKIKTKAVRTPKEALNKLIEAANGNNPFDIFLISHENITLNEIKKIEEICANLKNHTPIIAVTSYNLSEISEEIEANKIGVFIPKPLFKYSIFNLLLNVHGNKHNFNNAPESAYSFKGKRILLVEDNSTNMEIANIMFSDMGFKIDKAKNGKAALNMFENSSPGRYNIILMDVQMPIMNGYETAKLIRSSKHPQSEKIPIIAMTATSFDEDINKAIDSGMNDYITKPIDTDTLMLIVSKYID